MASATASTENHNPPDAGAPQNPDQPFFLDDLHVGQRFAGGSHVLDEAQIKAFAREFDPQPFHLDDAVAKTTLFGGLAASGWHTAAITMRLLVRSGLPIAGGIIGSGGELSWLKPARPGDTLSVESEVVEIIPSRSRPDRGSVVVRTHTRNQHGDVVQTFTARLVVPRRAPPPADFSGAEPAAAKSADR